MPRNKKEITAEELFDLIESISKYMDHEIKIYALGGTALTILNLKRSTKDIDFNIDSIKEYEHICKAFEDIGFSNNGIGWYSQEGLRFDLFSESNILGTQLLADCTKKSTFIRAFGNIKLYTLSLQDIIISKLARGDTRDFEDIKTILKTGKIDLRALAKRYKETMKDSIVGAYKQKLLDLIEIKFNEWGITLDKELIAEVEKWQST